MNIELKYLLKLEEKSIFCYNLTNSNNLSCTITNYGATIMTITYKSNHDELKNLALGFNNFETYINNSLYAGATLGPNAGRLSNGLLPIKNKIYNLSKNDNSNNLHGGFNNISFSIWSFVKESRDSDSISITLSLNIPHKRDGFPGNRTINATFTLTNNNELKVKYEGTSDMNTYMNLSNHCYFNLSGDFNTSVLDHSLTINASNYLENTEDHCAFKISTVENTPFDFRKTHKLIEHMDNFKLNNQLLLGKGYNNGFYLDKKEIPNHPDLTLESPNGEVSLKVFTDAPCIVLYSGGYIEKGLILSDGAITKSNCALAIEAQDYPNGPNLPFLTTSTLHKGEKYERNIIYQFNFKI